MRDDSKPSHQEHRRQAPECLGCRVITVSDTRSAATDRSGPLLREFLERQGHRVIAASILPDEPARLREAILAGAADPDCDVLLLSGGTGIAPRDRSAEVLEEVCDRLLPGFGELFRWLSWEEIGAAAMLSRAAAGICSGTLIIAMPGSPGAVRLAMEKLVLPEMAHIVFEARKGGA